MTLLDRPMTMSDTNHLSASGETDHCADLEEELARVRGERDLLRSRIDRVAEAIGCENPEKVVHDVRNVLNELVLLRKLVELNDD